MIDFLSDFRSGEWIQGPGKNGYSGCKQPYFFGIISLAAIVFNEKQVGLI